jgi:phosphoglycolate phosphatase
MAVPSSSHVSRGGWGRPVPGGPVRAGLVDPCPAAARGTLRATAAIPLKGTAIHRLVLWNVDLTLVDVVRVSREAYAEAFRRVTGRPLVALPQLAGRSDSEIFFESAALNDVPCGPRGSDNPGQGGQELLARYIWELGAAFAARRDLLTRNGRLLPGAREAVAATAALPGVVQSVVTGSIRANAAEKLTAFGLAGYFDLDVGGFGSDPYPKGSQLLRSVTAAAEKYRVPITAEGTVFIADSSRDVEAARIAGIRCAAVASGRSTVSDLRAAGADVVLPDLSDTALVVAAADRLTGVAAGR